MTDTPGYDSLIFDMDGTIWDAVDSYAEIWNRTNPEFGIQTRVSRQDLLNYMGKPIDVIFSKLFDKDIAVDKAEYLKRLDYWESTLMPVLGGKMYPGVLDGISALSKRYPIFMVSNCGSDGLQNMMEYTGLKPYVTDTLTYGETGHGKDKNIATIIKRHNLKCPLYIGDTQGDSDAAHVAGADMGFVSWGFGTCHDAQLRFNSFPELTQTLLNL